MNSAAVGDEVILKVQINCSHHYFARTILSTVACLEDYFVLDPKNELSTGVCHRLPNGAEDGFDNARKHDIVSSAF